MRKLKLFFACLLMAVLSIGQMWADEVTFTYSDYKGNGTQSSGSSYTMSDKADVTIANTKFYGNNSYAHFYANGTTTITPAANVTITGITLTASATNYNGYESSGKYTASTGSVSGSTTSTTVTWSGSATSAFTISNTKQIRWTSIVVTYTKGGGTDPIAVTGVTLDQNEAEIAVGGTVELTPTVAPSNATNKAVTWESSDETIATVADGVVTGVATGTATITVKTSDGNKTATCAVTVTAAPAASNWQVIAPADLATGDVVVLTMLKNNVYYAAPNNGSGAPAATVVAVSNDKLTNTPAETLQWTVTVVADGEYQFSVGTNYLKCSDTNNGVRVGAVGTGEYNTFDINTTNAKQYLHTTATMTSASSGRYLGIYNTQDWRCYSSVNNNIKDGTLVIFKDASAAPAVAKPVISADEYFATSTNVTITQNNADAIYYTTNGDVPTTSSTLYSAPFSLTNTATVKAIAVKGSDVSDIAEKTFNKAENKTVAEALTIINGLADNAKTDAYYCVHGVITGTPNIDWESIYKNATYNIKDANVDNVLNVFRGKYVNNADFDQAGMIQEGDEVTVFGQLLKYVKNQSITPEINQGNYITVFYPKARLAWSEASYEADIDNQQSNVYPNLTNTNEVTVEYSSSNTDAATIDPATGEITLVAVGSTTITASFAGNANYKANSASYTLNVASSVIRADISFEENGGETVADLTQQTSLPDPLPTTTKAGKNFGGWWTTSDFQAGTEAVAGAAVESTEAITLYAKWLDPYTVAQAKAVIDAAPAGTENQYVAGIISQIDSYNGTYHSITYWISADGTTTDQLEVYSGLIGNAATALEKQNFTQKEDLELGDEVVVTGTLKKYNDIYEFDKNNTIYTFSRKESAGLVYAVTAVNKVVGDADFVNELTNPHSVAVTYGTSDDQVATVANDGTVTIIGAGSATITASFAGNDQYKAAEVSYTLTVSAAPAPLSPYATVYTSNVAFTGQNSYETGGSKVVIGGVQYDAQKVGASSNQGQVLVTVPAKTHTLHFHAFTWKNKTNVISISGVTNPSVTTFDLIGDNGGGASSPYTIAGNPTDHYYSVTFDDVAEETEITFSYNSGEDKRFIMYGINQEGGVLPVLDHIVITGTATALEYETGDVFSPVGLGVDAYYTLDNQPVAEPTHLDVDKNWSGWSFNPAILTESATVTVTATYEGKQDTKDVAVTVTAPATPEILVNPASIDFGTVYQNAIVDAQGISVTLKAVDAATVTLEGDGFSIDKAALSELNSTIIVTPATTAAGTFAATVTISDNAGVAADVVINLSMKVEAVEDLSGTWIKATSVAAGDRIIIGATYNNATKTMGQQNTNNRAAVASQYENLVLTPADGTKTFLVVDAGDGKFALQALNGNYLTSATSGTGNNLWEAANYENDNAKWTITIDANGVASVVAAAGSKTDLQYNNSNNIFSCYSAGGQKPINIYKKGTPDYGSYNRDGLTGNYGTICLPNAGTIAGATLFDIDYYDGGSTLYILQVNGNEMEAGKPYIFLPAAGEITVTYTDNAGADAGSFRGLVGSYSKETILANDENYILLNNQYHLVDGTAYVGENRAYIHMASVPTEPTPQQSNAPRRRVAMNVQNEQVATGVDALNATEAPVKMIINGQLFILRGEKMYNVNGQLVK